MICRLLPLPYLIAVLVGIASANPAKADPISTFLVDFFAEYLLGKGIDEIWEPLTGKPNLRKLDQRLTTLEQNAGTRSEIRELIAQLRKKVDDKVSKADFDRMAHQLIQDLNETKSRIDAIEERLEKLEVENQDFKNGTKNSERAVYYVDRGRQFQKDKQNFRAIANFNLAVRLDQSPASLTARARYYLDIGATDVAMIGFTESISKQENADAYLGRAEIYHRKGNYRNAIIDADKALNHGDGKLGSQLIKRVIASLPDLQKEIDAITMERKAVEALMIDEVKALASTKVNWQDKLPLINIPNRKNEINQLESLIRQHDFNVRSLNKQKKNLEIIKSHLLTYSFEEKIKLQPSKVNIDAKAASDDLKRIIDGLNRVYEQDRLKLKLMQQDNRK